MDTQIINIASRRIAGLPSSVRIESLHFLAGADAFRNLYIRQCAAFVHSALICHDSDIQRRLIREIGEIV